MRSAPARVAIAMRRRIGFMVLVLSSATNIVVGSIVEVAGRVVDQEGKAVAGAAAGRGPGAVHLRGIGPVAGRDVRDDVPRPQQSPRGYRPLAAPRRSRCDCRRAGTSS